MKKLLTIMIFAAAGQLTAQTYAVDAEKSLVFWHAEKVTGEHDGTVNIQSGNLVMTSGVLTGGEFIMDMNSIECTNLEGDWKNSLEEHLKSKDFFWAKKHPTSIMIITKAIPDKDNIYDIEANMSIKGFTKTVKFKASVMKEAPGLRAVADIVLNRADYDIRYKSGSFFNDLGDQTIYDEFTIKVDIVAVQGVN